MRRLVVTAVVMLTLASSGCAARYVRSSLPPSNPLPPTSVTRHVLVVSVDGLRPDAITAYSAPTLQRLMREGAYTLSATTIDPSNTLPSHTSMLTGQPPEQHGVKWNHVFTADAKTIDVPNVFSIARANGYRTAAFFSKAKFQPLQRAGTLDYSQAPGGWFGRWSSERTLADVASYLQTARPNLLFIHLSDVDAAGHRAGWMSDSYGRAVMTVDAGLSSLVDLAERTFGRGNFSLIVTADHGGHGGGHGTKDPRDVTIPWIAWGQGVRQGIIEQPIVKTMDTAATVLWLLGIAAQGDWAGRAVTRAFLGSEAGGRGCDCGETSVQRRCYRIVM